MYDIYSSEGTLQISLPFGGQLHPFVLKDVVVAFYDGGRAAHQEPGIGCLLNTLISSFCGKMTHVELAFRFESKEIGRESWFACPVYQGHTLQFKAKQYDTLWEVIDLQLKDVEKDRLFKLCRSDVELALDFDGWFFVNFITPSCASKTEPLQLSRKTWCSEHVASRLAVLGYDFGRSASRVTPIHIYSTLKDRGYTQFRHSRTMSV